MQRRARQTQVTATVQRLEDRTLLSTPGVSSQISAISADSAVAVQGLQSEAGESDVGAADLPAPLTIVDTIDGLDMLEDQAANGNWTIPASPRLAVGPNYIWQIAGETVAAYDKATGARVSLTPLLAIFNAHAPANLQSPRIAYDWETGRMVIAVLNEAGRNTGTPTDDRSEVFWAVTRNGDSPFEGHHTQADDVLESIGGENYRAEDLGLAASKQGLLGTWNLRRSEGPAGNGGVRVGALVRGHGSGGLWDGGTSTLYIHNPYVGGGIATTTKPARMLSTPTGSTIMYLAAYGAVNVGGVERVQVTEVGGTLAAPSFTVNLVVVGDVDNNAAAMPDAPQSGATALVEMGNRRVLSAVFRNGRLHFTSTVVPPSGPDAGQATAHWWELDMTVPGNPTLADQGNIGGEDLGPGTHTGYASVAVDAAGNVGYTFFATNATMFPGSYAAYHYADDPDGFVGASEEVCGGEDYYVRTFGGPRNDLAGGSAMVIDPVDSSFWAGGACAGTRGFLINGEDGVWQTRIVNLRLPAPILIDFGINNFSGNSSGLNSMAWVFDGPAAILPAILPELELRNHTTGSVFNLTGGTVVGNGTDTVKVYLPPGLNLDDGRYTCGLAPSHTVPQMEFRVVNGFHILWGDTNSDGVINFGDTDAISRNFGATGGEPFDDGDTSGDGNVTFDETTALGQNFAASVAELEYDFGDAWEQDVGGGVFVGYPTTLQFHGARHIITGNNLMLGTARDAEPDGQPSVDAMDDDTTGPVDDEDGVVITGNGGNLQIGAFVTLDVTVSGATGTATLNAWIDFNQDGDWDDLGERVFPNRPVSNGVNTLTVMAPADAVVGTTFARFRLDSRGFLYHSGLAHDGEVEDYEITIVAGSDMPMDTAAELESALYVPAPSQQQPRLVVAAARSALPAAFVGDRPDRS